MTQLNRAIALALAILVATCVAAPAGAIHLDDGNYHGCAFGLWLTIGVFALIGFGIWWFRPRGDG